MANPVRVGDTAPNFSLPNQMGQTINSADLLGKGAVVLYFYPKDDSPGCTAQSCAFRDSYAVFKDAGAEVVGISADDPASHRQFATKHNLPFTLLSDTQNRVRELFGVPATLWVLPGRVTYVMDKQGIVRHIFDSAFDFQAHAQEALSVLRKLA